MACSYTSIPSTFAAAAGYTSPMNVESLLRNKVDIYSPSSVERSLLNAAVPTPFAAAAGIHNVNAFASSPAAYNSFASPIECGAETGRVFGAECGAQLAAIVAARLNTFVGQEVAVRIGAQWGAEMCAKLGAELAVKLVNGWPVEQCARWCYTFGAEHGAELGAIIAQRLGAIYTAEFAARIGAELFADVCAKQCYVIAARVAESRFRAANPWNAARLANNWTGSFERFGGINYPTTFGSFGANTWANNGNNTWSNTMSADNKLYNIAFRPSSEVELYTLTHPIRMIDVEGNRQLYLCFELKGFKPEEVTVTLNKAERAVVVEAAHEAKDGKEHTVARKYSRKFVLPETLAKIDLTKVELKSCLTQEGHLVVECQLPKMTTEEIAKCPTMSELYNKLPAFGGFNAAAQAFGGINGVNCHVNAVKPVTVKTA